VVGAQGTVLDTTLHEGMIPGHCTLLIGFISPPQGSSDHTIIHSRDIVTIERTSLKPHCLFLEVKGKSYWLSLESDAVLYGWLDDIIHHCHLSQTTTPENFVHHVHVYCDPITGCYEVFHTIDAILRPLRQS
jgi:hypothetical protein